MMSRRVYEWRVALVSACAAGALVLTGCGNGDDPGEPAPTPPTMSGDGTATSDAGEEASPPVTNPLAQPPSTPRNPLAGASAPPDPLVGAFTGERLSMRSERTEDGYRGELELNDMVLPFTATVEDGVLQGTFTFDGHAFGFTATLEDGVMTLATEDSTYTMAAAGRDSDERQSNQTVLAGGSGGQQGTVLPSAPPPSPPPAPPILPTQPDDSGRSSGGGQSTPLPPPAPPLPMDPPANPPADQQGGQTGDQGGGQTGSGQDPFDRLRGLTGDTSGGGQTTPGGSGGGLGGGTGGGTGGHTGTDQTGGETPQTPTKVEPPPAVEQVYAGAVQSFQHPRGWYTLDMPRGWSVASIEEDGVIVNPGLNEGDTLEALIIVLNGELDPDERNMPVNELLDKSDAETAELFQQLGLRMNRPAGKAQRVRVGELAGAEQVWQGQTMDGTPVRVWVGAVAEREYYLAVFGLMMETHRDRYLPGMKRMFTSLKATPPQRNRELERAFVGRSIAYNSTTQSGSSTVIYAFREDGSVRKEHIVSFANTGELSVPGGSTEETGRYEVIGDVMYLYFSNGQQSGTIAMDGGQIAGVRFGQSLYRLR